MTYGEEYKKLKEQRKEQLEEAMKVRAEGAGEGAGAGRGRGRGEGKEEEDEGRRKRRINPEILTMQGGKPQIDKISDHIGKQSFTR